MPHLNQTLQRLGLSFTVRDIMIPKERLVCAADETEAQKVSQLNPDFNIIPVQDGGWIKAFYERDMRTLRSISIHDLVGSDTSVINLVEILSAREFCFVLVGNEVGGYVHFSDLNNLLVKLAFYVVFEAFERHLLAIISPVTEQEIEKYLSLTRLGKIRKEVNKAQDESAHLSLGSCLFLREILNIAVAKGNLPLNLERDEVINMYRNRVSHSGRSLIQKHGDVKILIEAMRTCLEVLEENPEAVPA